MHTIRIVSLLFIFMILSGCVIAKEKPTLQPTSETPPPLQLIQECRPTDSKDFPTKTAHRLWLINTSTEPITIIPQTLKSGQQIKILYAKDKDDLDFYIRSNRVYVTQFAETIEQDQVLQPNDKFFLGHTDWWSDSLNVAFREMTNGHWYFQSSLTIQVQSNANNSTEYFLVSNQSHISIKNDTRDICPQCGLHMCTHTQTPPTLLITQKPFKFTTNSTIDDSPVFTLSVKNITSQPIVIPEQFLNYGLNLRTYISRFAERAVQTHRGEGYAVHIFDTFGFEKDIMLKPGEEYIIGDFSAKCIFVDDKYDEASEVGTIGYDDSGLWYYATGVDIVTRDMQGNEFYHRIVTEPSILSVNKNEN
ncbi:hypothetical protein JD969_03335 [Planctomycetota bacterium]|nr:hypothetical protein JD969_03335 [Planctomycetota bacterium]